MSTERLQKILAGAGVASRRAAEQLITEGRVRVNGRIVRELGSRANPARDRVEVDGKRLVAEHPVYFLLHKPRGVVTTMDDPEGRRTVKDLLHNIPQRVFPVGRLDFQTSGVLLLTNDGDLAQALLHPTRAVPKTYSAKFQGVVDERGLEMLRTGVTLDDGEKTAPAHVHILRSDDKNTSLEITISEGKNRQIHRMGDAINRPVLRLTRTSFAGLSIEGLRAGQIRPLKPIELGDLKQKFLYVKKPLGRGRRGGIEGHERELAPSEPAVEAAHPTPTGRRNDSPRDRPRRAGWDKRSGGKPPAPTRDSASGGRQARTTRSDPRHGATFDRKPSHVTGADPRRTRPDRQPSRATPPEPRHARTDGQASHAKAPDPRYGRSDRQPARTKAPDPRYARSDRQPRRATPPEPRHARTDGQARRATPPEPRHARSDRQPTRATPPEPRRARSDRQPTRATPPEPRHARSDRQPTRATPPEPRHARTDGQARRVTPPEPRHARADGQAHRATPPEPRHGASNRRPARVTQPDPRAAPDKRTAVRVTAPQPRHATTNRQPSRAVPPQPRHAALEKKPSRTPADAPPQPKRTEREKRRQRWKP